MVYEYRMRIIECTTRIMIAAFMIGSAFGKVMTLGATSYGISLLIGIPTVAGHMITLMLIIIELMIGIFIALHPTDKWLLTGIITLLLLLIMNIYFVIHNRDSYCYCFGSFALSPIGKDGIARAAGLLASISCVLLWGRWLKSKYTNLKVPKQIATSILISGLLSIVCVVVFQMRVMIYPDTNPLFDERMLRSATFKTGESDESNQSLLGNTGLIVFFSPSCGQCQEDSFVWNELHNIVVQDELRDEYIVLVSTDSNYQTRTFLEGRHINIEFIQINPERLRVLGIRSIPLYVWMVSGHIDWYTKNVHEVRKVLGYEVTKSEIATGLSTKIPN